MKSIENIHEITKAMEMIAAFRFKRAEGRFTRSRHYFREMEALVGNLAGSARDLAEPLFEKREIRRKALLVLSSDKGLCGSYNANLIKAAQRWVTDNAAFEPALLVAGKVGLDFFRKRKTPIFVTRPEKTAVDLAYAKRLNAEASRLFLDRTVDSIEVLYAAYRPGSSGLPTIIPYLGLSSLAEGRSTDSSRDYLYEPGVREVLDEILPKYLEGKTYLLLLEALTSEFSARMVAMKQATENGEEVLDNLSLLRNKTRQATITRELSEIVGGASALA